MMIEVAYAQEEKQVVIPLQVTPGTTVRIAIERSGILNLFPEIDLMQSKVGIFGKLVPLQTEIKSGDRIEIYRPLTVDPKQARILRAAKAKQKPKP